jgi:hypothetical protein
VHILLWSITKHGRHRQFFFLIGRFLKIFSQVMAKAHIALARWAKKLKITCNTHFQILWYKIEFDWNISYIPLISYNWKGLHVREIDGDYYHKHVIFIKSSRPCAVFTVVFLLMIKPCCILLVGQDIFQYQECTLLKSWK